LIALINHQTQAYVRARAKAHEITAPSRTQQGHCGGGGSNVEGGRGEDIGVQALWVAGHMQLHALLALSEGPASSPPCLAVSAGGGISCRDLARGAQRRRHADSHALRDALKVEPSLLRLHIFFISDGIVHWNICGPVLVLQIRGSTARRRSKFALPVRTGQ
jgi:hypothetical protein